MTHAPQPAGRRPWAGVLAWAVLAASLPAPVAAAETYAIDPDHSAVAFRIRHLVSYVTGRFRDFSGTIRVNPDDLEESSVELTIRTASIDTANEKRDAHLRSPEFFDATRYPEITFRSTAISKSSADTYDVTGVFSMHGVDDTITVPVEVLGFTSHPQLGKRAGFAARFELDRGDYGIDWNLPMQAGSFVLGNEVRIEIDIEAVVPQSQPGS